jgi:hypothetical protein
LGGRGIKSCGRIRARAGQAKVSRSKPSKHAYSSRIDLFVDIVTDFVP